MIRKVYKYGEAIVREGEVPPGLVIIYNGQAKCVSQRPGEHNSESLKRRHLPPWSNSKMPPLHKCHDEIDRDRKLLKHLKDLEKSQQNDILKDKD